MIYQRLKSLLTQQKFLKNSSISSTHTFETLSRSIINNTNFCKCVTRPFRCMHVNCFNQLRHLPDVSTKLQKMHFLDNLRTITPGGNMKSVLCFVLPPEPNTHFFQGPAHGLYIHFIPKTRHSLCTALFLALTTNSIVRQNGNRKQIASEHSKTLLFINIRTISIKEVNLSTKGHMHILKGQSKNQKLLKKLL